MRVVPPIFRHAPESRRASRVALTLAALLLAVPLPPAVAAQELTPLPLLSTSGVQDRTDEDLIRARWSVVPAPTYPGQRATLVLTVQIDEAFLEAHVVQPFTRRLELPIALDDPRISGIEVDAWGLDADEQGGVLLALGGRLVRAVSLGSRTLDGRQWRGVQLEAHVTPAQPGRFELPAAVVRFAAAESFREELLGRAPIDPRLAFASGTAHEWIVADFPEAGRDPDFAGALGRYRVSAVVDERAPRLGDQLELVVTIHGAPLEDHALPRLDRLRGLHLVSQSVNRGQDVTELRAELRVERATLREIPSITMHSFDPQTAQYLTAASEPIPLTVSVPLDAGRGADAPRPVPRWVAWLFLGAGLGLAILFKRRRSRARRHLRS